MAENNPKQIPDTLEQKAQETIQKTEQLQVKKQQTEALLKDTSSQLQELEQNNPERTKDITKLRNGIEKLEQVLTILGEQLKEREAASIKVKEQLKEYTDTQTELRTKAIELTARSNFPNGKPTQKLTTRANTTLQKLQELRANKAWLEANREAMFGTGQGQGAMRIWTEIIEANNDQWPEDYESQAKLVEVIAMAESIVNTEVQEAVFDNKENLTLFTAEIGKEFQKSIIIANKLKNIENTIPAENGIDLKINISEEYKKILYSDTSKVQVAGFGEGVYLPGTTDQGLYDMWQANLEKGQWPTDRAKQLNLIQVYTILKATNERFLQNHAVLEANAAAVRKGEDSPIVLAENAEPYVAPESQRKAFSDIEQVGKNILKIPSKGAFYIRQKGAYTSKLEGNTTGVGEGTNVYVAKRPSKNADFVTVQAIRPELIEIQRVGVDQGFIPFTEVMKVDLAPIAPATDAEFKARQRTQPETSTPTNDTKEPIVPDEATKQTPKATPSDTNTPKATVEQTAQVGTKIEQLDSRHFVLQAPNKLDIKIIYPNGREAGYISTIDAVTRNNSTIGIGDQNYYFNAIRRKEGGRYGATIDFTINDPRVKILVRQAGTDNEYIPLAARNGSKKAKETIEAQLAPNGSIEQVGENQFKINSSGDVYVESRGAKRMNDTLHDVRTQNRTTKVGAYAGSPYVAERVGNAVIVTIKRGDCDVFISTNGRRNLQKLGSPVVQPTKPNNNSVEPERKTDNTPASPSSKPTKAPSYAEQAKALEKTTEQYAAMNLTELLKAEPPERKEYKERNAYMAQVANKSIEYYHNTINAKDADTFANNPRWKAYVGTIYNQISLVRAGTKQYEDINGTELNVSRSELQDPTRQSRILQLGKLVANYQTERTSWEETKKTNMYEAANTVETPQAGLALAEQLRPTLKNGVLVKRLKETEALYKEAYDMLLKDKNEPALTLLLQQWVNTLERFTAADKADDAIQTAEINNSGSLLERIKLSNPALAKQNPAEWSDTDLFEALYKVNTQTEQIKPTAKQLTSLLNATVNAEAIMGKDGLIYAGDDANPSTELLYDVIDIETYLEQYKTDLKEVEQATQRNIHLGMVQSFNKEALQGMLDSFSSPNSNGSLAGLTYYSSKSAEQKSGALKTTEEKNTPEQVEEIDESIPPPPNAADTAALEAAQAKLQEAENSTTELTAEEQALLDGIIEQADDGNGSLQSSLTSDEEGALKLLESLSKEAQANPAVEKAAVEKAVKKLKERQPAAESAPQYPAGISVQNGVITIQGTGTFNMTIDGANRTMNARSYTSNCQEFSATRINGNWQITPKGTHSIAIKRSTDRSYVTIVGTKEAYTPPAVSSNAETNNVPRSVLRPSSMAELQTIIRNNKRVLVKYGFKGCHCCDKMDNENALGNAKAQLPNTVVVDVNIRLDRAFNRFAGYPGFELHVDGSQRTSSSNYKTSSQLIHMARSY